ncbi:hypothetical protein ACHAXS_003167 [Conticribra weissflogii]
MSRLVGAPLFGYLANKIGTKEAAGIMGVVSGISLALVPLAPLVSKVVGCGGGGGMVSSSTTLSSLLHPHHYVVIIVAIHPSS